MQLVDSLNNSKTIDEIDMIKIFRNSIVLFLVMYSNYAYSYATIGLSAINKQYRNNEIVHVKVDFSPRDTINHAIQFDIQYPPELRPQLPIAGYALFPNGSKAFNIYTAEVGSGSMRIIIVPERMMQNHVVPLRSGRLLEIPFKVEGVAEGVVFQQFVSIRSNSVVMSHDYSKYYPYQNGYSSVTSNARFMISSYKLCKDLNGTSFVAADGILQDGDTVNYPVVNTHVYSDINDDGTCDTFAITGGVDSDGDGLSDAVELNYDFLNPYDSSDAALDYDGDGLTNVWELTHNLNPSVDENYLAGDSDKDGLSNQLETSLGTKIDIADTDGDKMNDGFEYENSFPLFSPTNTGPACTSTTTTASFSNGTGPADDYDCDSLTNLQEHDLGTNPKSRDSDNDGVEDAVELAQGRNPAVNEAALMEIINTLLLDDTEEVNQAVMGIINNILFDDEPVE